MVTKKFWVTCRNQEIVINYANIEVEATSEDEAIAKVEQMLEDDNDIPYQWDPKSETVDNEPWEVYEAEEIKEKE